MTLVTVSDADLLALGGALPRQGFLQVWRVTGVAGKLDFAKEAEHSIRGVVSFTIDPSGAMAHRLAPRGVPAISEQWLVIVPNVDTITLSELVTAHSVDPSTLQPLNPLPPSAAEILADASDARDVAVGVSTGLPAAAATAVGAQVQEQVAPLVSQTAGSASAAAGSASSATSAAATAQQAAASVPALATAAVGEQVTAQVTPLVGAAAGSASSAATSEGNAATSAGAAATSAANAGGAAAAAVAPIATEINTGRLSQPALAASFDSRQSAEDRALMNAQSASDVSRLLSLFLGVASGVYLRASTPTANRASGVLSAASTIGATTLQVSVALTPGRYKVDAETVTVTAVTGATAPFTAALAVPATAAHASAAAIASVELDYQLIRGIGSGRFVVNELTWKTNNPPAYSYGLNQLGRCYLAAPLVSVGHADAALVRVGAWLGPNANAAAFSGSYRYATAAGATLTWTTPAGTTKVGGRGPQNTDGAASVVSIDGDKTRATMLPTAQQMVDAGNLPSGALVANGGTVNPTDRMWATYRSGLVYDATTVFADDLTAGAHTIVVTTTGYQRASLTNGRAYYSALASGTATTAPTDAGAELFVTNWIHAEDATTSAWEYADNERPPGVGTSTYIGNIHGYERQDTLAVFDGDNTAPTVLTAGQIVAATRGSFRITRTSSLFHPSSLITPTKTASVLYVLDRSGLSVTSDMTYTQAMEVLNAYMMMPTNGALSTSGAFDRAGLLSLPSLLSFPGSSDTRYGHSFSAAVWVWGSTTKVGALCYMPDVYGSTDGWVKASPEIASVQDRTGGLTKVYLAWLGSRGGARTIPAGTAKRRSVRYLANYFPTGAETILASA